MTTSLFPNGCIVVGVDGSDHATRAVVWAAEQAALEARSLAIVHCTAQGSVRGTSWQDAEGFDHESLTRAVNSAARMILATAAGRATAAVPDIPVLTELLDVDPRIALVDLSEHAHLLVLGSRGRGPLKTALLGSVSAFVASHADCPVVVCRPSDHESPPVAEVVVGADGGEASRPVLEYAFAQASLRRTPLTVMHCFWDVAAATGGKGVVQDDDKDLSDLRLLLAESVAGLAEKYPDVQVTQELARGLVDECLADLAPAAELLVVGRAERHGWSRFVHTSCALAVVERARTTVAVVPEHTHERNEQ